MKKINFIIMTLLLLSTFAFSVEEKKCEAMLDLEIITGFFGIPKGIKNKGYDVYFDFDTDKKYVVEKDAPAPEGWDLLITYISKKVKMGPMGTNPVPFIDACVNDTSNCSYYMIENEFHNIKNIDSTKFKKGGWTGYGHRKFKDNKKLESQKYKNAFPFLCYDWYELVKITKFRYQAYAGRIFIVRSSDSKYYKVKFTELIGKYIDDNKNKKLYSIKFIYAPITGK